MALDALPGYGEPVVGEMLDDMQTPPGQLLEWAAEELGQEMAIWIE